MAGWVLKTLGGTNLQESSGKYTSRFERHAVRFQTGAVNVSAAPRGDLYPSYAGTSFAERIIRVNHEIAGSGSTHETNLNLLKSEHYDPAFGPRTLVFTADSVDKRATVVAARLLPHDSGIGREMVVGEWTILEQRFYADSAAVVTPVAKSASPATLAVPNAGTIRSPEIVWTLKPTTAKSAANGQRYGQYVTPVYRSSRPAVNWPVDICDTVGGLGWDHAAEVTATRSQADGDDVEVYVNGKRVNRWFGPTAIGAVNQTDTSVWVNLDFPPGRAWTYNGSATLADDATACKVSETLVGMPATPFYGAFVDGTTIEVVRVTAVNVDTKTLTIVRAQRGTSATTWAVGKQLWWTPVLVDLVYGGTSLAAPDYIDNAYKPIHLDSTSDRCDNGHWHMVDFQETYVAADTQDRKPRGGSWRTRNLAPMDRECKDGEGDLWLRYIPRTATLSTDAAVASKMCLAYRSSGALAGHPIMDRWEFQTPIGVSSFTYTWDVQTLDFDSDLEAQLEVSVVDGDGNEEILATHDATTNTETLTPSANGYVIWFKVDPYDPKIDASTTDVQAQEPTDADGFTIDTLVVNFASAEEILVKWGASRRDVYQFGRPNAGATLANTDSQTLTLDGIVVDVNDTLDIDTANRTVTVDDGTGRAHLVTGTYPWAPAGTKNVTYTETGIGQVEVGVSGFRSAWI